MDRLGKWNQYNVPKGRLWVRGSPWGKSVTLRHRGVPLPDPRRSDTIRNFQWPLAAAGEIVSDLA